jgi:hypothetical protein
VSGVPYEEVVFQITDDGKCTVLSKKSVEKVCENEVHHVTTISVFPLSQLYNKSIYSAIDTTYELKLSEEENDSKLIDTEGPSSSSQPTENITFNDSPIPHIAFAEPYLEDSESHSGEFPTPSYRKERKLATSQVYISTLRSSPISVASTSDFYCDAYSAFDTNYASQNYATCNIWACGGSIITASMCEGVCSGDTYLVLVDGLGVVVSENDDGCDLCSYLTYSISGESDACDTFTLREGCYSSNSCSGQVHVTVTILQPTSVPTARPTQPTSVPTARPTMPTSVPTARPTQPTSVPTVWPTQQTSVPTVRPTQPTSVPTVRPTSQPTFHSFVTISSFLDTSSAYASYCNPATPTANCNLRSAFAYCQSISIRCTIDIPFKSSIVLQYGEISLSSESNIILEGHQSVISASDGHNGRFLTLNGCENIEIHDLTIEKFGEPANGIYGGSMYISASSDIVISNVTFNDSEAYIGGVLYMYAYTINY